MRVAIADVDALVPAGSAIDAHARTNTTTVYTAASIFSMMPERLSTDLTSLNQDEERLAMIVQMDVRRRRDGRRHATSIARRVRNRARLSYDAVAAWLDGGRRRPLSGRPRSRDSRRICELQDRVAQAMKSRRHRHGALRLDTIEATVGIHRRGVDGTQAGRKNRAKELIEDFMIAANTARRRFSSAGLSVDSPRPALARPLGSHRCARAQPGRYVARRSPDARGSGGISPTPPGRRSARFPDLSLSVVKLLGAGEYAVERPGA